MSTALLLAEPDARLAELLQTSVASVVDVHAHRQFETAREDLLSLRFDFIVTNLRLHAYNGLHLVHLAATSGSEARAIVYTDYFDAALAREVQRAGAFYETRECLAMALTGYLQARLPPRDRRDAGIRDRRLVFRGGRRCWDKADVYPAF